VKKIDDRIYLGLVSGVIGWVFFTLIGKITVKMGVSKRSYPTISAGILVSSRREAEKWSGQLLGTIMNIGLCMVGGVSIVKLLTTFGRDKLVAKGLFFGITFGGAITALLNKLTNKKVVPSDPSSNLSYLLSHAVFGLVSVFSAAKIGDDSLFDVPPQNDYLRPTEKTTEQIKGSKGPNEKNIQPVYSDVRINLEEISSVSH